MTYTLLNNIDDPADLRKLDRRQLGTLADELRAYVLESVSRPAVTCRPTWARWS